jgi:hypothetical protein
MSDIKQDGFEASYVLYASLMSWIIIALDNRERASLSVKGREHHLPMISVKQPRPSLATSVCEQIDAAMHRANP